MVSNFIVYTEGKVDKLILNLIRTDLYYKSSFSEKLTTVSIRQSMGNSGVIKSLHDSKSNCIGIIDNDKDKRKPADLDKFQDCDEIDNTKFIKKYDLQVKFKKGGNYYKYLFIINPAPEKWLDYCVDKIGKSRVEYGLPDDFDEYKTKSKHLRKEDENNFSMYIKDLLKKSLPMKFYAKSIKKVLKHHGIE